MPDVPDLLRVEEYRALRNTIQQRGSLRVALTVITFSVWAGTILFVCSQSTLLFLSLVPLIILTAGFEAVFALHIGVERIGRYIQAHHEPASHGQARWEESALGFRGPSGGAHPLFPWMFISAALINLTLGFLYGLGLAEPLTSSQGGLGAVVVPGGFVPVALLHLLLVARVILATRYAAGQRARDLEEYRRILKSE